MGSVRIPRDALQLENGGVRIPRDALQLEMGVSFVGMSRYYSKTGWVSQEI